jgi:hypothetical protein
MRVRTTDKLPDDLDRNISLIVVIILTTGSLSTSHIMAIGKWIPFTGTQSTTAESQSVKSVAVQVISSADAKKFGLENVSSKPSMSISTLLTLQSC